jgi:hypothetical protein
MIHDYGATSLIFGVGVTPSGAASPLTVTEQEAEEFLPAESVIVTAAFFAPAAV